MQDDVTVHKAADIEEARKKNFMLRLKNLLAKIAYGRRKPTKRKMGGEKLRRPAGKSNTFTFRKWIVSWERRDEVLKLADDKGCSG